MGLQLTQGDEKTLPGLFSLPHRTVIPTGVFMGLRPTPGDEKRGLSLSGYHKTVIPTEAKRSGGTCCSADLSWKCFSTERSGVERSAVQRILSDM
jgi:hypothetical protein